MRTFSNAKDLKKSNINELDITKINGVPVRLLTITNKSVYFYDVNKQANHHFRAPYIVEYNN